MTPLRRLVLLVALLGVVVQLAAASLLGGAGPVLPHLRALGGLSPGMLLAGALLLTVAGDMLSVPVRRGEETEELTLYEAAVVVAVLLLPARDALWVPVAGMAVASLLQRRDPLKSVFNLGNHGIATALLVVVVHQISGPGHGLDWRTVLALLLGLLGFSAVILAGLIRVLAVVGHGDGHARQVVLDGARLALVTAIATIPMAGGGVVAGDVAPALLPFSLVPAVALLFAFRATAQSSEQRQRSARLLALSHVLAGRTDPDALVPAFLAQCRRAFGADVALVLLATAVVPEHGGGLTALDERGRGASTHPTTAAERALLDGGGTGLLTGPLPDGWAQALVAPLEADGAPLGVLALATRERTRPLGPSELTLLTPLASALAGALSGAAHLRRLTEATSKLQAVVDQSSDGILVLDGAGTVHLWSPALQTLTGASEAGATGRPLSELISVLGADGTPCDPFEAGRSLLSPVEPQATVELTLLREDGEQRVLRCAHAGAFEDGALTRDVVIVHDVTRERQVERLKADFIATVSHELRTPVTPIKGYADLLRRRGDTMTPQRRDECLAVISDRCNHLGRLVEDLLLASRISATEGASPAQVDMSRDDLVALVQRAAGDFGTDGERVRLVLPPGPVDAACDPVRVVQVLTNLVGNALKYSPAGAPVDVRLTVGPGSAVVEVEDRGRGIPADQLERVFEKFHRVEDPLRMTTGGTGLGLYIARHLATAMGGSLHCRSTLGVGSVFRFQLPLAAAPAVPEAPVVPHVLTIPAALPAPPVPTVPAQAGAPEAGPFPLHATAGTPAAPPPGGAPSARGRSARSGSRG